MSFDISEPGYSIDFIAGREKDPDIKAKVRAAEILLCGKDGDAVQARTQILNLALCHLQALDEGAGGGTWSEAADQLNELAATANQMAAQFKHLKEGPLLLLLKESCKEQEGIRQKADLDGLFPELQRGVFLGPALEGNVKWEDDLEPGAPALDSSGVPTADQGLQAVREIGPRWISRTEALATACQEGARLAQERAGKRGRRTALGELFGSPELQLLWECATQLHRLEGDDSEAYALAKVVHHLVTGNPPSPDWAGEAKRRFEPWWTEVRDWWGRETEAPEEIQVLLRQGIQAIPKRSRKHS